MSQTFQPGQNLTCTINKVPRTAARIATLTRLMRQDPKIRASQRRAQHDRKRNAVIYTRGGRPWHKRPKCGKGVKLREGESWTMTFVPQLGPDLASISDFIEVKAD